MHESDALFLIRIAPKGYTYFDRFARSLARIERRQRRMLRLLGDIQQGDDEEFKIVMQELDDLMREVQEEKGATASLIALTEGLAAKLNEQADSAKTLQELKASVKAAAQELDDNQRAIVAAVAANPLPGDTFTPSGN
jgi:hypothetical protein